MDSPFVDLVADLGEGYGSYTAGDDEALLDIVTSANIACGYHAGDPSIMRLTVERCVTNDVSIGAHPGFPDIRGFGRYSIDMPPSEVYADVLYQIGALSGFCRAAGGSIAHVAPHGRLGNLAGTNRSYADAIVNAASAFSPDIVILGQDGELTRAGHTAGMRVAYLGIIDRAYEDDGQLVRRGLPGAVLHDSEAVVDRALRMVLEGIVTSINGKDIPVAVQSLLLHGDEPGAAEISRRVRDALEAEGVEVASLHKYPGQAI